MVIVLKTEAAFTSGSNLGNSTERMVIGEVNKVTTSEMNRRND